MYVYVMSRKFLGMIYLEAVKVASVRNSLNMAGLLNADDKCDGVELSLDMYVSYIIFFDKL